MTRKRTLDDVLSDDPHGLLANIEPDAPKASRGNRDAFFEAINEFVDKHGREPSLESEDNPEEYKLALNLKGVRSTPDKAAELREMDRHGLLSDEGVAEAHETASPDAGAPDRHQADHESQETPEAPREAPAPDVENVTSLADILAADPHGLLASNPEADDVYEMTHVKAVDSSRTSPDEIADRQVCEDFDFFEPLFERMRARIQSQDAKVVAFENSGDIRVGDYFFLRGQMCLVDSIEKTEEREGGEVVYRVRVVFDNGTEMYPYKHSLGRALSGQKSKGYERGQRILDPDVVADQFNGITHRSHSTGFIYALMSERDHPVIRKQRDLFKIGLTRNEIKTRLSGAERQPTYLEGPVRIAGEWQVYGANLRKVEEVLHAFFAPRRANFELIGADGKRYRPREWFNVPYSTIKKAVEAVSDDTLHLYRLDPISGEMVRKVSRPSQPNKDAQ